MRVFYQEMSWLDRRRQNQALAERYAEIPSVRIPQSCDETKHPLPGSVPHALVFVTRSEGISCDRSFAGIILKCGARIKVTADMWRIGTTYFPLYFEPILSYFGYTCDSSTVFFRVSNHLWFGRQLPVASPRCSQFQKCLQTNGEMLWSVKLLTRQIKDGFDLASFVSC